MSTIYATELINIHIRRCFEELGGSGLESVCDANWLLNVYNEVTTGTGSPRVVPEFRETKERFMPAFEPVNRSGLTQVLAYECRNLAAVASNNVWMHFQKRLLSHVRHVFRLSEDDYQSLTNKYRALDLNSDREVVLAAVQLNGWALLYASADLKNDREVVLAAVQQNGWAVVLAPFNKTCEVCD